MLKIGFIVGKDDQFYNDDNYLYQYGIPDEMLKILTTD